MSDLTIAVDGPASSGKGTVARGVARELGYQYVDTGAMYRSVALLAREHDLSWSDEQACASIASELSFRFVWQGQKLRVFVDGRDVSEAIRTNQIGTGASQVSILPAVRAALLDAQRSLGRTGGVVMDGRDIGTVIFPDADLKVYLDASLEERARRRHAELVGRGEAITLESVRSALSERDSADMSRAVSPLKVAEDAVHIDTTALSIPEAIDRVLDLARQRGA